MTTLAQCATLYSVAEKSVMDGRFKGEESMGADYKTGGEKGMGTDYKKQWFQQYNIAYKRNPRVPSNSNSLTSSYNGRSAASALTRHHNFE